MGPLNTLMNRVDGWSQKVNPETGANQSLFKREVLTRAATLIVGVPTEVAAVAQNILLTPIALGGFAFKFVENVFTGFTKERRHELSESFRHLLQTIGKIFGYAIGTISTAVVGLISPDANFKLHISLDLAHRNARHLPHFGAEPHKHNNKVAANITTAIAKAEAEAQAAKKAVDVAAAKLEKKIVTAAHDAEKAAGAAAVKIEKKIVIAAHDAEKATKTAADHFEIAFKKYAQFISCGHCFKDEHKAVKV